jgi:hypothetical protein
MRERYVKNMASKTSTPIKEAYRTFNRAVKKFLCYCRDTFPELESPAKSGLILLKVTKSVSIKFAYNVYMELFDNQYKSYLDAHNTDFFISKEFTVQFIEDYVEKFKCCFRECTESEQDKIWQVAHGMLEARDAILRLKEGGSTGSDVETDV